MRQWTAGVVIGLLGVLAIVLFAPPTALLDPGEYDRTTVQVHDENGTLLGTVEVWVADTTEKRRVGLSRTDSLGADEGMLFVHTDSDSHTYNMRGMAFPLDIVFIAANGTITEVHHAEVADGLLDDTYTGTGKYVLEVERGWTVARGVDAGDKVRVPGNVTASDSWLWFT
jgi:uncharacterized membrane protein (UPF0127 family)